jgi:hypothetical protein
MVVVVVDFLQVFTKNRRRRRRRKRRRRRRREREGWRLGICTTMTKALPLLYIGVRGQGWLASQASRAGSKRRKPFTPNFLKLGPKETLGFSLAASIKMGSRMCRYDPTGSTKINISLLA